MKFEIKLVLIGLSGTAPEFFQYMTRLPSVPLSSQNIVRSAEELLTGFYVNVCMFGFNSQDYLKTTA